MQSVREAATMRPKVLRGTQRQVQDDVERGFVGNGLAAEAALKI